MLSFGDPSVPKWFFLRRSGRETCVCVCVFHLPRTSLNRLSVCRTFRLASKLWPTLEVSPLPPSADLAPFRNTPIPLLDIVFRVETYFDSLLHGRKGERATVVSCMGGKYFFPGLFPSPPCSTFAPAVSDNATGRRVLGCSFDRFPFKTIWGGEAEKQPF